MPSRSQPEGDRLLVRSVVTAHVTSAQRWLRSLAEAPRAWSVTYPRQQRAPLASSADAATGGVLVTSPQLTAIATRSQR